MCLQNGKISEIIKLDNDHDEFIVDINHKMINNYTDIKRNDNNNNSNPF